MGFPVFNRKVLPFIFWSYSPLLNNDVSLRNLVVPVVVIPTNPILAKTEFICKSYCDFIFVRFFNRKEKKKKCALAGRPPAGPMPAQDGSQARRVGLHPGLPLSPARPGRAIRPAASVASPASCARGPALGQGGGRPPCSFFCL